MLLYYNEFHVVLSYLAVCLNGFCFSTNKNASFFKTINNAQKFAKWFFKITIIFKRIEAKIIFTQYLVSNKIGICFTIDWDLGRGTYKFFSINSQACSGLKWWFCLHFVQEGYMYWYLTFYRVWKVLNHRFYIAFFAICNYYQIKRNV